MKLRTMGEIFGATGLIGFFALVGGIGGFLWFSETNRVVPSFVFDAMGIGILTFVLSATAVNEIAKRIKQESKTARK